VETLDYGKFSQTLHRRLIGANIPLNGSIEVTRRCPLTCSHCYNNLAMSDREAVRRELTLDEHCRILDQIADAGCLWLLYTGGEIFARRDFLDIYTHARRRGFLITLFTNGTMITPAVGDALAAHPPFAIEVTLYGRTRETYERLTGIPGSYDRCLRGIQVLRDRALPLALKTVAVTINRHELPDMQRFAEEDLGVPFKFDAMMNPRLDCSQAPLGVRLSPEQCVELDLADDRRMVEWKLFADRSAGAPLAHPAVNDDLYGCGGGLTAFAINPYGEMSICTLSQRDLYDLRAGTFDEGWHHFLRSVRGRKATAITKCRACQLKEMCGMCPANGELENGNPESPVDFLCRVAHLRAYAFGLPVPAHGECEYCAGGAGYSEMTDSLAALRSRRSWESIATDSRRAGQLLPVIPSGTGGCSTGGCDGCRGH
jgi:radical SAM protein with 4Fe4S-binding SPASM domain